MIQTAFNGGEITSLAHGRPDLAIFPTACSRMENFRAMLHGGFQRDPGTEHLGNTESDGQARLLPWNPAQDSRLMCEYTAEKVRFWSTGTTPALLVPEVTTPYLVGDLRRVHLARLNRFVTHAHSDHAPQSMSAETDGSISWAEYAFRFPPLLDENTDESHTMTFNGTATLTSSATFFEAGHVGAVFEIAHKRTIEQARILQDLDDSATDDETDSIVVDGEFTLQTRGNWKALITVQQSSDGGSTWEDILFFESDYDANYNDAPYTTSERVLLRVALTERDIASAANNPKVILTASDPLVRGTVRVTAIVSGTEATVTEEDDTRTEATYQWSEAAFSDYRGWPSAVTYHRQRLAFGGTAAEPQKIWFSRIDNYDDFRRPSGTDEAADADAAFSLNIVSETQNRIEFLSSQRELVVGTDEGEYVLAGDQENGAFGPGSYRVVPLSYFGGAGLQPITSETGLIFLQDEARVVRHIGALVDVVYSPQEQPDEMSLYGEHLIRSQVVEHAYQRNPDPIYWAVTGDGGLAGYTHKPGQRVLAWHRHTFGEGVKVESVAVTSSDFEEDQLWVSLLHELDAGDERTIERIALGMREAQEQAASAVTMDEVTNETVIDQEVLAEAYGKFRYLNHFRELDVVEDTVYTLTGLDYLEGKNLTMTLDGVVLTGEIEDGTNIYLVTGGEVEFTAPSTGRLVYGIHHRPLLVTLPPVMQSQGGTVGFLTESQIGRIHLLPWNSIEATIGTSASPKSKDVIRRDVHTELEDFPPLKSDPVTIDGFGGSSSRPSIRISCESPMPFTLLAINYDLQPRERV